MKTNLKIIKNEQKEIILETKAMSYEYLALIDYKKGDEDSIRINYTLSFNGIEGQYQYDEKAIMLTESINKVIRMNLPGCDKITFYIDYAGNKIKEYGKIEFNLINNRLG